MGPDPKIYLTCYSAIAAADSRGLEHKDQAEGELSPLGHSQWSERWGPCEPEGTAGPLCLTGPVVAAYRV